MVEEELKELIDKIVKRGCEEQTMEVKAAHLGCPEKLYDTISAFSNQNSGGIFVFGLDEKSGFKKVGVYDAQDLQKKVMEYCEQMTPVVRPVFTVYDEDDKVFVSAEIPPLDIAERPCFKTAGGRLYGSFIRVGEADKPMTEYEVYSYEAFRKKTHDEKRETEGVTISSLDNLKVDNYVSLKLSQRPNLALLSKEQQYELCGVTCLNKITLMGLLLFGIYPQAYYPQLSIIASAVPGKEIGHLDGDGNRFSDTKRIEGTLPEMLEGALSFVRTNMKTAIKIMPETGERVDVSQYPMTAVREAVLNALIHRDYSIHTQDMPIQLVMYEDRLEITNPGRLYGRLTLDQLGFVQSDTRNPGIVTAMETLGKTENRYSGIPTIRYAMKSHTLPDPVFSSMNGSFKVTLYNSLSEASHPFDNINKKTNVDTKDEKGLIDFCRFPRSRDEIIQHIGIASCEYSLRRYLSPLLRVGAIVLTIPDSPRSRKQRYVTSS